MDFNTSMPSNNTYNVYYFYIFRKKIKCVISITNNKSSFCSTSCAFAYLFIGGMRAKGRKQNKKIVKTDLICNQSANLVEQVYGI